MLLLRHKQNIAEKAKKLQKVAQKSCNVPQKLRPKHSFLTIFRYNKKTPWQESLLGRFKFVFAGKF